MIKFCIWNRDIDFFYQIFINIKSQSTFHLLWFNTGIEALGNIEETVASMGKSFLERLKDLKEGTPLEVVAGDMWVSRIHKINNPNNLINVFIIENLVGNRGKNDWLEKIKLSMI